LSDELPELPDSVWQIELVELCRATSMSENLIKTSEYRAFIQEIKQRVQSAQVKAAVAVYEESVIAKQLVAQIPLIVQQLVAQISWELLWVMGIVGNLARVKV
jgi:hypothetical protein